MRRIALCLTLLAVALPALADDKDLCIDEKLVGTWVVYGPYKAMDTKVTSGNKTITLEKDGKAILKEKGKPDLVGTWTADPSRTPMELDVTVTRQEGRRPETLKAVYTVKGDHAQVFYSLEGWGKERPKSADGRTAYALGLHRQKP